MKNETKNETKKKDVVQEALELVREFDKMKDKAKERGDDLYGKLRECRHDVAEKRGFCIKYMVKPLTDENIQKSLDNDQAYQNACKEGMAAQVAMDNYRREMEAGIPGKASKHIDAAIRENNDRAWRRIAEALVNVDQAILEYEAANETLVRARREVADILYIDHEEQKKEYAITKWYGLQNIDMTDVICRLKQSGCFTMMRKAMDSNS